MLLARMGATTIQRVLFAMDLHPGSLLLVEMRDASLCILRDGEVQGPRWTLKQIDAAVLAYERMRAKLRGRPSDPPTQPR